MSGYNYWHGVYIVDVNGVPVPAGGTPSSPSSVQGAVADGAAAGATLPLLIAGRFDVTEPTYDNGDIASLQVGQRGSLQVQLMAADSVTAIGSNGDTTDAIAATATTFKLATMARLMSYNGTSFDRVRSDPTKTGALLGVPTGGATQGGTTARVMSAATTNATVAKASTGTLYDLQLTNTGAAAVFFKLYNKATAPVVGTDVPLWTIAIPAGQAVQMTLPVGKLFGAGIAYAITNLVADTDTTAVVLNQVTGALTYV